jgi:hypothetical protein
MLAWVTSRSWRAPAVTIASRIDASADTRSRRADDHPPADPEVVILRVKSISVANGAEKRPASRKAPSTDDQPLRG